MKAKFITILVLISVAGLLCNSHALAQSGDIAVVVNSSNNTATLTKGELRKIFAGEKRSWAGVAGPQLNCW